VIEAGIHDRFVEALAQKAKGDLAWSWSSLTRHGTSQFGHAAGKDCRLSRPGARARGAQFICGGNASGDPETGKGYFIEPTIVANRPAGDELVQEEIFGPVLTVQKADDAEHALELANCTRFGLVAGIFTGEFLQGTSARPRHRCRSDLHQRVLSPAASKSPSAATSNPASAARRASKASRAIARSRALRQRSANPSP
jgi:aldehyde dehydrogenase (NAD+)